MDTIISSFINHVSRHFNISKPELETIWASYQNITSSSVAQLRDILKSKNMSSIGTKRELIDRILREHDEHPLTSYFKKLNTIIDSNSQQKTEPITRIIHLVRHGEFVVHEPTNLILEDGIVTGRYVDGVMKRLTKADIETCTDWRFQYISTLLFEEDTGVVKTDDKDIHDLMDSRIQELMAYKEDDEKYELDEIDDA